MFRENESGFITLSGLIVITILGIMLAGASLFVYTKQKKALSYKIMYTREKQALALISELEKDIQNLKNDEFDSELSTGILFLNDKYSDFNFTITDVSTGINENFLSIKILETEEIKDLLKRYQDEIKTDFGWLNPKISEVKKLEEVHKDFTDRDIFPLINTLPPFNFYYMNEDFIKAVCEICSLKDSEQDLNTLYKTNSTHKVFDFIGFKTQFWNISFSTDFYNISCIFAAVPEKNNQNKIERYILIEKHLEYKGGVK